jgi:hypothetical protein
MEQFVALRRGKFVVRGGVCSAPRGDCGDAARRCGFAPRDRGPLCARPGMGKSGHNAGDEVFVACGLIARAVALNETPLCGGCWRYRPGVEGAGIVMRADGG